MLCHPNRKLEDTFFSEHVHLELHVDNKLFEEVLNYTT